MKFNKWTLGLAAVGVVSLTSASAARADETKISQLNTALSNTTISGYVDASAQFTPQSGSTTGANNVNNAPNYYYGSSANSINLNVVDITIDHPLDESPWASGYHVDLNFGPAAINGYNGGYNSGVYDGYVNNNFGIRQAYIALRTPVGNGIDWKVGIFDTIVGYESTTSANNPNYTHSYGYNMEPTTHTGVLASYKATDWISMQAGIADESYAGGGSYNSSSTSGLYHPTFMWGPTLTAPDSFGWAKGATLSIATIITGSNTSGNPGTNPYNGAGGQTFYAGVTVPTPVAALKFGAAFDYLAAHDVSGNAWDGALYSTYQFNDKLSLNLRGEYYNGAPLNASTAYYGSSKQQAQEITATVQYALWANVLTRLEVRWDHVCHSNGYETPGGTPEQNAFLLAAQAIYTF